jgi:hypothetical protein
MTDGKSERLTVTVAETTIILSLAYPDGSHVQLTMPKPVGVEDQTSEQAEQLARRMAGRLLGVAVEDLRGQP